MITLTKQWRYSGSALRASVFRCSARLFFWRLRKGACQRLAECFHLGEEIQNSSFNIPCSYGVTALVARRGETAANWSAERSAIWPGSLRNPAERGTAKPNVERYLKMFRDGIEVGGISNNKHSA